MKKVLVLVVVLALALGGCSGMTATEERVLGGTAIGASAAPSSARRRARPRWVRPSALAPGWWAAFSTTSSRSRGQ